MIGIIEFNKVQSIEKVLYDIQRCVLLHVATNLTLIYFVKITREKHTSEAYLEPSQTFDIELFKK